MAIKDQEAFLSRWSRLKRAEGEQQPDPPARPGDEAAPALPPLDQVTPESDFAPFMHPKVADALRRVALKKLFADPHFNVPDLNEAFSGDWTGGEPIGPELLKTLNQARTVLYREEEELKKKEEAARATQAAGAREAEPKEDDDPARQDA
jgi:Protein of unknown function (DUF3306)